MNVNALRGHVSELGLVAAKGIENVEELVAKAANDAGLPGAAQACVTFFAAQIAAHDETIRAIEKQIKRVHAQDNVSRLFDTIPWRRSDHRHGGPAHRSGTERV